MLLRLPCAPPSGAAPSSVAPRRRRRVAACAAAADETEVASCFPPLRLGALLLPSAAILSPMESVSDVGFRRLCFEQGAALTWCAARFAACAPPRNGTQRRSAAPLGAPLTRRAGRRTEMVRASALARNNGSSFDMLDTHDDSTPTGVQLLAKSVDELQGALERLEAGAATSRPQLRNIAAVDLNFGCDARLPACLQRALSVGAAFVRCPSPDVIRNGSGPAMLKRRARLTDLFTALVAWRRDCGLDVRCVGAKIRLGLNRTEMDAKVYLPLVDAANEAGLDYLVVHARHAGQRSRDAPTWDAIAEVKARAAMPVIGNGNVFSAADAVAMRRQTGCDGVMLARAAIRNPWVFRDFALPSAGAEQGGSDWDGGRYWPTLAEVDAAAQAYAEWAQRAGTKPKFVAFHERNFERLRRVAATGDRSLAVDSPATIHLT